MASVSRLQEADAAASTPRSALNPKSVEQITAEALQFFQSTSAALAGMPVRDDGEDPNGDST